jgi:hypothetical protein
LGVGLVKVAVGDIVCDFGGFGVFGSTGVVRAYRETRCVFLEVHDILTELRDLGSGIFKGVLCGGTLLGLLIC